VPTTLTHLRSDWIAWILWAGLAIAWAMIPLIVLQYVRGVVPLRYKEIRDRFLRKPPAGSHAKQGGTGKSAAWHYVRLLSPDAEETDVKRVLDAQFWYFHDTKRYVRALLLVMALSGLMLSLSGLWIMDRLRDPVRGDGAKVEEPKELTSGATADGPAEAVPPENAPPAQAAGAEKGGASTLVGQITATLIMALWGAFVWSLYEVWSRRKSGDLTPVELVDVAIRFIVAVPIGYAFSLLVPVAAPLGAFAASAFPLRYVRLLIRKQMLPKTGESVPNPLVLTAKGRFSEGLSGIGHDTIARLQELNIETYLDLAYADPIRLMVKTGVPIQLVLAWIDQALLAVYAAPHKAKFELLGMPCALDVREFYEDHWLDPDTGREKDWRNDPAVKELATSLSIPLEVLPQLLRSIYADPHVQFLSSAWYGPATAPDRT
jgi:hypothetical protein